MKTIEIKVFEFDELSAESKEKAIESLWDINVSDEFWSEFIIDDAKKVGIEIISFDTDRYCKIKVPDARTTAEKIIETHGIESDTYKDSISFEAECETLICESTIDEDGDLFNESELDNQLLELEREYAHSLAEDYRIMLRRHYEYLTSEEAIVESIKANEYLFTENGEPFI